MKSENKPRPDANHECDPDCPYQDVGIADDGCPDGCGTDKYCSPALRARVAELEAAVEQLKVELGAACDNWESHRDNAKTLRARIATLEAERKSKKLVDDGWESYEDMIKELVLIRADDAEARVSELEAEVAEAIKEIGVWSRKAGLAESERDRLKATVERVGAVHRLMLTSSEFATVNMAGKLRSALDDPTPPKGGDDDE